MAIIGKLRKKNTESKSRSPDKKPLSKKKKTLIGIICFLFIVLSIALCGAYKVYAFPIRSEGKFYVEIEDYTNKNPTWTKYEVVVTTPPGTQSTSSYQVSLHPRCIDGANCFDINMWANASIEDGHASAGHTDRWFVIPLQFSINKCNGVGDYFIYSWELKNTTSQNAADATTMTVNSNADNVVEVKLDTNNCHLTEMADDGGATYAECTIKLQVAPKNYSLSINPNGGSYEGSTGVSTKTVSFGQQSNNQIGVPTRAGYRFLGWYTSPSKGEGSQIYNNAGHWNECGYWTSDGRYRALGNFGVYAQWESNASPPTPKYTVTCKDHHGDGTVTERTKVVDSGTSVGGCSTFGTDCKTGEEYDHDDGWHTITGDTTVHIYYKLKKYTVTCEDHHASGTVTKRTKSIDYGTSVGGYSTFGTDCKTGEEYDHDDGWHTITGDTTVHIYYKLKKYTVTCKDHHADGTITTRTKSISHGTDVGGFSTFGTDCKTGEEYDKDDGWHNITGDTTIHIYYKYKIYTMTVYHKKYLPNSDSWEHFATTTHTAKYSSKFCPPYSKTPTGYHNHSRDWNSGWTVTGDGAFNVYYYSNSYNQTINYYYNKASGTYNKPTHTKTLLGSKSWSKLYGTTFNAKAHKADWGDVGGYHWSSIDNESWIVTCAASTNSYYSVNTYRLSVDKKDGSAVATYDMECGTNINLGTPTRTGWKFKGWEIVTNNSTNSTLSSNTFTMGYNNSYKYQTYVAVPTVKIIANWEDVTAPVVANTILKATNPTKTTTYASVTATTPKADTPWVNNNVLLTFTSKDNESGLSGLGIYCNKA